MSQPSRPGETSSGKISPISRSPTCHHAGRCALSLSATATSFFPTEGAARRFGDSAFSVSVPRAWNRLPIERKLMRSSTTTFKRHLNCLTRHTPLTDYTVSEKKVPLYFLS